MNPFQSYSPASPTQSENEGLSSLELELENRKTRIPILNERYEEALVAMEVADRNLQLEENKKRSFRNKRKRQECTGCKRKWCNTCVFNNAAKRVRVIGLDIEFNESEIKVISQEVELERQQRRERAQSNAFHSVPPCPEPPFSDDEDESITGNSGEVKEEPDVKVEPEDDYVPTIGMVNAVKSEPMDSDAGIESDDDSEDDSDDSENNDENNDSIETDEEVQDQYPDTPDNTDYSTDTEAESDNDPDTDGDSDAEADPIQRFRNILCKL